MYALPRVTYSSIAVSWHSCGQAALLQRGVVQVCVCVCVFKGREGGSIAGARRKRIWIQQSPAFSPQYFLI